MEKKGNCLGNQQFNNIAAYVNHFLLLLLISECLLSARRTMKDICKEKENRQHQDTQRGRIKHRIAWV